MSLIIQTAATRLPQLVPAAAFCAAHVARTLATSTVVRQPTEKTRPTVGEQKYKSFAEYRALAIKYGPLVNHGSTQLYHSHEDYGYGVSEAFAAQARRREYKEEDVEVTNGVRERI